MAKKDNKENSAPEANNRLVPEHPGSAASVVKPKSNKQLKYFKYLERRKFFRPRNNSPIMNQLPKLILAQDSNYSLVKNILSEFEVRKNYLLVYHLWLDALYDSNVDYKDIIAGISPLLDTGVKKQTFSMRNVYIIAKKFHDNCVKPTGSCYLLLSKDVKSLSSNKDLELDIFQSRLHMTEVEGSDLRRQLRERTTLLFADAFKDLVQTAGVERMIESCKRNGLSDSKDQQSMPKSPLAKVSSSPTQQQAAFSGLKVSKVDADNQQVNAQIQNKVSPSFSKASDGGSPYSTTSDAPNLVRIASKERAAFIVESHRGPQFSFFRFVRQSGSGPVSRELLNNVAKGVNFQWDNIFFMGATLRSGILALSKEQCDTLRKLVVNQRPDAEVVFTEKNHEDFRAVVNNIAQAYEFQSRATLKRKVPEHSPPQESQAEKAGGSSSTDKTTKKIIPDLHNSESSRVKVISCSVLEEQKSPIVKNTPSETNFVPITAETLKYAKAWVEKHQQDQSIVMFIYDTIFQRPNLSFELLQEHFRSILGTIEEERLFIRTNSRQLLPNLSEALARGSPNTNRALLIYPKDTSEAALVQKLESQDILYGRTTFQCLIKYLEEGSISVSSRALIKAGAPVESVTKVVSGQDDDGRNKASSNVAARITEPRPNTAPRSPNGTTTSRNRIAAVLQYNQSIDDQIEQSNNRASEQTSTNGLNGLSGLISDSTIGKRAKKLFDNEDSDESISKHLSRLNQLGNVIVSAENLPAKLTVHALNVMFGTLSITADRIVATKMPSKNVDNQMMNLMIVFKPDDPDIEKLLSKDSFRNLYDKPLQIKRTDSKKLEKFLKTNWNRIHQLETSNQLPLNGIAYGRQSR